MSNSDKNWKNKVLAEIDSIEENYAEAKRVPVSELSVGSKIVTAWRTVGNLFDGFWEIPHKTVTVESIVPCEGNNGMHRHINRNQCYDSRSYVWIKE